MQFGEYSHLRPQDLRNDRHRQIIDCAMLVALQAIQIGEVDGGDEDDCRLLETRMLPYQFGQFEAVDFRHADVHQHRRNVKLQKLLESVLGRRCLDQIFVKFGKNGFIAEQLPRLIIDHQDVHPIVRRHLFSERVLRSVFRMLCRSAVLGARAHRCSHIRNAESN